MAITSVGDCSLFRVIIIVIITVTVMFCYWRMLVMLVSILLIRDYDGIVLFSWRGMRLFISTFISCKIARITLLLKFCIHIWSLYDVLFITFELNLSLSVNMV